MKRAESRCGVEKVRGAGGATEVVVRQCPDNCRGITDRDGEAEDVGFRSVLRQQLEELIAVAALRTIVNLPSGEPLHRHVSPLARRVELQICHPMMASFLGRPEALVELR